MSIQLIHSLIRNSAFVIRYSIFVFIISAPLRAGNITTIFIGDHEYLNNPFEPWHYVHHELYDRFLKKYPDYRIKVGASLRLWDQYAPDALVMSMATGLAPDIIQVPQRLATDFIEQGFLYPLDEYYAEWEKDPGFKDRVDPALYPLIRQQGHYWFVPDYPSVQVLFYRKDLFKAAGIEIPPVTWDQFYDCAQKLTVPEKNQYGFGVFGRPSTPAWRWTMFLWQAGGEVFKQDDQGRPLANLDTPEAVTALKFYHKLLRGPWQRNGKSYQGVAKVTDYLIYDKFRDGSLAMIIEFLYNHWKYDPAVIGYAPLPAGPHGHQAHMLTSYLTGMNGQIKEKTHRDAVWHYIQYLRGDEASYLWVKYMVETGNTKFVSNQSLTKYGFERHALKTDDQHYQWVDSLARAHGRPEPFQRGSNVIYTEMEQAVNQAVIYDTVDYQAVLAQTNDHINRLVLGRIPDDIMQRRRLIALAAVLVLGAGFSILLVRFVVSSIKTGTRHLSRSGSLVWYRRVHIWAWALLAPAVLTVLVWHYYPLLRGLVIAFMDYRVVGTSTWTGPDNFIRAFWQPDFWTAFKNTVVYVTLTVSMGFLIPLILALLLYEVPRGGLFFRIVFYLPAVISSLVVSLLWRDFYNPGREGLFNQIITVLGFSEQLWLKDPQLAMLCIIVPGIWATAGAGSILYLAALKQVPLELYEQAEIDGAPVLAKAWYVTIPTLKPLLVIQLVGTVIGAFHATQRILVMTGGGPFKATHTLGIEIFYNAFVFMKYGYATAVAWIMGALLVGFTIFQLRVLKSVRFTTLGIKEGA